MGKELRLTVNGQPYELYVTPKTLLVEVLRNELGLTGTKRGCESSSCGICTVILNGMAVKKSCSILAFQADGTDITTVEGLAKGDKLHPLEKAFLDYGAYQCGFCTPGMLASAKAFPDENPLRLISYMTVLRPFCYVLLNSPAYEVNYYNSFSNRVPAN